MSAPMLVYAGSVLRFQSCSKIGAHEFSILRWIHITVPFFTIERFKYKKFNTFVQ